MTLEDIAEGDRFALDDEGNVRLKSYEIEFQPNYVLVVDPLDPGRTLFPLSSLPTGRCPISFRFTLSPEAFKLVADQDPKIRCGQGWSTLSIIFDSTRTGPAMIRVTRGVRRWELDPGLPHGETCHVPSR